MIKHSFSISISVLGRSDTHNLFIYSGKIMIIIESKLFGNGYDWLVCIGQIKIGKFDLRIQNILL